jgi:hypothetical protein|tara:strand:+ start:6656 stop:6859 length:204 start_codon:yes stop_codon:yes gene_type:complete
MTKAICTATIKMNTKELLKCINALDYFINRFTNEMTPDNYEGYQKILKDCKVIYKQMLAKEDTADSE